MTYLTKIVLDPKADEGRAHPLQLTPDHIHRMLAELTGAPVGDQGRYLWRLDGNVLWVVSPTHPDEAPGAVSQKTLHMGGLLDSLTEGDRFRFALRANPTRSQGGTWGQPRGTRRALIGREEQMGWLTDRAPVLGVRFETAFRDYTATHRFTKRGRDRRQCEVTVVTADFTGVLTITDPAALSRAITHGVGRSKTYGCGLLLLGARVASSPP